MDERLTQEEQSQISQAFAEFATVQVQPAPEPQPAAPVSAPPERMAKKLPRRAKYAIGFALICLCIAIVIAALPKPASTPKPSRSMTARRATIAAGIAVKNDGTVVCTTPAYQPYLQAWTDVIEVSADSSELYALKQDGTVLVHGGTTAYQNRIAAWKNITSIDAGADHLAGLTADGTVVAVSNYYDTDYGATDTGDWKDIIGISAGAFHTVGLKADGTVVSTQITLPNDPLLAYTLAIDVGQTDVESWKNIVAISAGSFHTVGLKADGTVVAIGSNTHGQCDISEWRDIIAISAGYSHTLGLKADGTVVAAGNNLSRQCEVSRFSDVVAIAASSSESYIQTSDGTVFSTLDGTILGKDYVYAAAFVDIRSPLR